MTTPTKSKPIVVHRKPFEYDDTLDLPSQFTGEPPTAIIAEDPGGWSECTLCNWDEMAPFSLYISQEYWGSPRHYRRQSLGLCASCSALPTHELKKALRTLAIARLLEATPAVAAFLRADNPKGRRNCEGWEAQLSGVADIMRIHDDPESTIVSLSDVLRQRIELEKEAAV